MTPTLLPHQAMPGVERPRILGWHRNMMQFLYDPIGHMTWLYKTHGRIAAFDKGHTDWILAVGPEFNQQFLSNTDLFWPGALPFPVPEGSALQRLRYNLTSMRGEKHKQQRRLVMPAFHKKRIVGYHADIVAIAEDILRRWPTTGNRPLDVAGQMQQLAMRVATKTLFGLEDARDVEVVRLIEEWMRLSASLPITLLPFDKPGLPYRRFLIVSEQLESAFKEMIERKRARVNSGEANDALSALLLAHDTDGERLTDAELVGQTNILFVAGYETTASALTWTMFLLSQHPKILADLLDEVEGRLHGDPPTLDQLADLPLLDRVIKESLRILPPVYITTRTCSDPFALGPYQMPAGSTVVFSHYLTHHLPELFPEPERFWPDRWLTSEPSPYAYMPFSAGARQCIGAAFASMEMKTVLPMILQRYRLTLPNGTRIDRSARGTLGPKQGMPMLVAPQDRRFTRTKVRGNIREMVDLE